MYCIYEQPQLLYVYKTHTQTYQTHEPAPEPAQNYPLLYTPYNEHTLLKIDTEVRRQRRQGACKPKRGLPIRANTQSILILRILIKSEKSKGFIARDLAT